jgi:cytidylate kinase
MYRAVTLFFIRHNIDLKDQESVNDALSAIQIDFKTSETQTLITLNSEDVSKEIRQMPVANKVSTVSAIKDVRLEMVKQQQRMGRSGNIVMDGRDIGTVVFPNADLKLFMTADPQIRAERRYNELISKDEKVNMEDIFENLAKRDFQDTTREESPLIQAEDAVVLDNSHIDETEQLEFALGYIKPLL